MAEQKACALCTLSHNISSAPASTRPPFRYTIWTTPPSSFACSTSTNSSCCTQESTLKTTLRCCNSSDQLAVMTHLRLASVEVSFGAALFDRVQHSAGARDPAARSRSLRTDSLRLLLLCSLDCNHCRIMCAPALFCHRCFGPLHGRIVCKRRVSSYHPIVADHVWADI